MTRDDILQMYAGRELDALVAERILGWFWIRNHVYGDNETVYRWLHSPRAEYARQWPPATGDEPLPHLWDVSAELPHYSTDIAAAWEVVAAMRAQGYDFVYAESDMGRPHAIFNDGDDRGEWAWADAAPEAICKAALLVVDERETSEVELAAGLDPVREYTATVVARDEREGASETKIPVMTFAEYMESDGEGPVLIDIDSCPVPVRNDYLRRNDNVLAGVLLCLDCEGTGNAFFSTYRACPSCGGSGHGWEGQVEKAAKQIVDDIVGQGDD